MRVLYTRLAKEVQNAELTRLMALPNGVDVVDAFGKGPDQGRQVAGPSLESCAAAVRDLRAAFKDDDREVWKYAPALGVGAQKFAKDLGRPQVAANLTKVATALTPSQTSGIGSVFGALDVAVLLLMCCGPIGAIVADVLAVVLTVAESAVAVVKEIEQDQAAIATTFADDGQKLSKGGHVGVAAIKGVLAISAVVVPVAVGRIVGKASVEGRVLEDVESTAAKDVDEVAASKAIKEKGTGDAARMTDGKQVSGKIADDAGKPISKPKSEGAAAGDVKKEAAHPGTEKKPAGDVAPADSGKKVSAKVADEVEKPIAGKPTVESTSVDEAKKGIAQKGTEGTATGQTASESGGKKLSGTIDEDVEKAIKSDARTETTLGPKAQKKRDKAYGSKGKNEDLDAEWASSPMREFEPGEVDAARKGLTPETLSQIKSAERKATVARDLGPGLGDFVGNETQEATCDRVLGRLLGGSPRLGEEEAALRAAGKIQRADVVKAANKAGDDLVGRLRAHWDGVVSPRGAPSTVAAKVYTDALGKAKSLAQVNEIVRENLFSSWREMFFTSIRNDPDLVIALREQAGIQLSESGSNFYIELSRVQEGGTIVTVENVPFNLDHSGIRLSDAVVDAIKTGDSNKLLSTINSKNLGFLVQQENTRVVEVLRRDNRRMWNYRATAKELAELGR
jgi:hypothetical protein